MVISKRNNIFVNVFEYIFIILAILNCFSIYEVQYNNINLLLNFIWQFALLFIVMFKQNKLLSFDNNKIVIFIFLLLIYFVIFVIANYLNYKFPPYYFFTILVDPVLLVIYFCSSNSYKALNNGLLFKFVDVVSILSIISLLFWILSLLNVPTNMTDNIRWGGYGMDTIRNINGYFYIHFITQKTTFIGINGWIRNTGIFAEAPMYSYVLCIALFIELFIKRNKKIFTAKVILLLITILSTSSTTGIMIALPALLYRAFISSNNKTKKLIFLLLIPILLIILHFILLNKMGNINDLHSSYSGRMNDISATISAWKNNIFIGNGLNNIDSVKPYMYSWRLLTNDTGLSTGFFAVLAYGGLLYSLFYIIPTILSFKCSSNIIGLAIFSFILLIYTIIFNTYICLILLSYLMACFIKSFDKTRSNRLI